MLNICFTPEAWEDFNYWQTQDKKTYKRIIKLIAECARDPFTGTGKPEPLRFALTGCWSRRIDLTNRFVYKVQDNTLWILQLRYHY
ncbi:MAG: Txe/YoeB family addiction module toxin [Victivallaceae bacterium]|nr:Txe/YoeB family addiction module toxin [Victivallaceae bacterium]